MFMLMRKILEIGIHFYCPANKNIDNSITNFKELMIKLMATTTSVQKWNQFIRRFERVSYQMLILLH
jgi:hypothetical protein